MRTLIVEADGASRGNPGEASYSAVVRDAESGEPLAESAESLGPATNNVAERRPRQSQTPAAAASPAAASATAADERASAPSAAPAKAAWSPHRGRPTRLLLLRHGVTPLTLEKRFAGIGDPPLTPLGEEQAHRAAERFRADERFGPVDVILASPLQRTRATAEAVAKAVGVGVLPEPGFRELDFGRLEGLSFAEANERYPAELAAFLGSPDVAPPGGETLTALSRRVGEARERVLAEYAHQTVLVATHVTPIKVLVCQALGAPLSAVNRMELGPASLSVIDFYDDGLANVRCVNDVAHLG